MESRSAYDDVRNVLSRQRFYRLINSFPEILYEFRGLEGSKICFCYREICNDGILSLKLDLDLERLSELLPVPELSLPRTLLKFGIKSEDVLASH